MPPVTRQHPPRTTAPSTSLHRTRPEHRSRTSPHPLDPPLLQPPAASSAGACPELPPSGQGPLGPGQEEQLQLPIAILGDVINMPLLLPLVSFLFKCIHQSWVESPLLAAGAEQPAPLPAPSVAGSLLPSCSLQDKGLGALGLVLVILDVNSIKKITDMELGCMCCHFSRSRAGRSGQGGHSLSLSRGQLCPGFAGTHGCCSLHIWLVRLLTPSPGRAPRVRWQPQAGKHRDR